MSAYADTSFLISLYTLDVNSKEAAKLSLEWNEPLLVTLFGEAEFVNAIELRVFRKEATPAEAEKSFRDFQADLLSASFLSSRAIPAMAFERAVLLSRQHTRTLGTQAIDVLHVAVSLELGALDFYTFDRNQRKLAQRAGLTVRPGR